MNLSTLFREGTTEEHTKAEKSKFIQAMFRGQISKDAYIAQLEALLHLYSALEHELEIHKKQEFVQKIYFPELFRKKSLQEDLDFFNGSTFIPKEPSKNTQSYISCIQKISAEDPKKLIPHAYVRYLGDLSGGQMLGKIIRKTFSLEEGLGDSFYTFAISDKDQFKVNYRAQLDDLKLDDHQKQELVQEARLAFQLNGDMFSELDVFLLSPK